MPGLESGAVVNYPRSDFKPAICQPVEESKPEAMPVVGDIDIKPAAYMLIAI
jgi:hypothetical protein